MVYYLTPINVGINQVASLGDGTTISINWFRAFPTIATNLVGYHIYFSTEKEKVYSEGVKFISLGNALEANITDLEPGQEYWFSVRPIEYSSSSNTDSLPIAYDDLRYYPSSLLRENLGDQDLIIKLLDTTGFVAPGIIKIGAELIRFNSVDAVNNNLIVANFGDRGVNNTYIRSHSVSGYDGRHTYNPFVSLFIGGESNKYDRIYACQSRFEYPNFPFTMVDGYRQVTKDLLNTDLSISDEYNEDFTSYDYSGWHRTDPTLLLNGTCVGSYIGGERGCIDGYGNFQRTRGLDLQNQNNQNQEQLIELTGKKAVLLRRQMTGKTCPCYLASSEYPDDRCPFCHGTKFIVGYTQYFNPRESDGKIWVRPDVTDETLKTLEAGLESEYNLKMWTLTVPTIKTKDIIVMFDQAGNEEFRYEVLSVTRNSTILGLQGAQKLNTARIRKFDQSYMIKSFSDTSTMPEWINTGIGYAIGSVAPHVHQIRKNEHDPSTWEQNTQVAEGHNHVVYVDENGELKVLEAMGHTHTIVG